jgi:hypothetical protein
MSHPTDPHPELDAHPLKAFADAELAGPENFAVARRLADDPAAADTVRHQQQLREACQRVMGGDALRCPDELRARVQAMAEAQPVDPVPAAASPAPAETASPPGPSVLGRVGRWAVPVAAAAAVALAVWLNDRPAGEGGYSADGLITAGLAARFGERHASCALDPELLYETQLFPTQADRLDDALAEHVADQLADASLDLSAVGYRLQTAGFCSLPGGRAVHVLYHHDASPDRTLSLWIKAYDGQPTLDPGVAYAPPRQHSGRPMVAWREADTVFYLVGDAAEDVRRAQPNIHLASRI